MSRLVVRGLGIVLLFPLTSLAADDQPTREQLQEELSALKSRVTELEQQQSQPATDQRDIANVIDEVVADAQRRSQLMFDDESITAGFDLEKMKFYIGSTDGSFLLVPGLFLQIRNATNINDSTDETNTGWEIRRLKILFEGHAFTPDLQYKFQWETRSNGGDVFLQDAWLRYKFAKDLSLQFGQYKDPWNHEETVGDHLQLAVERSLLNALIGGAQTDRIQGIMLMFDDKEHWRGNLVYDDGYRSLNTAFNEGGGSNFIGVIPTDFGFAGRLDYFAIGKSRKQYDNLSGYGSTEDLLVFGGGLSFSQAGDSNVLFQVIDAQYSNPNGLTLFGQLLGAYREIGAGEPIDPGNFYDWGFLVQGSYLFTKKLEGYVRYDLTNFDGESNVGDQDTYQEITVGMNYFFKANNIRMSIDFNWLPDGAPTNLPGLNYLTGDDNQFVIRGQFQLFI